MDYSKLSVTMKNGGIIDIGDTRIVIDQRPNQYLRLHISAQRQTPINHVTMKEGCVDAFDRAQTESLVRNNAVRLKDANE